MAKPGDTESVVGPGATDKNEEDLISESQNNEVKPPADAKPAKPAPVKSSFLDRRKAREAAGPASKTTAGAKAPGAKAAGGKKSTGAGAVRSGREGARLRRVALRALAALVLIAVIVVGAVFGVAKHRIDERNDLRAQYAAFAEQVTVNLTSFSPDNVDNLQKTLLEKTSGYAKQQMEQSVSQIVELVKSGKMSTQSHILSTAVTKAEPDSGSAIMVFGWTMKSSDPKDGDAVVTYRWRVDMTRINGEMKFTNFEWVV